MFVLNDFSDALRELMTLANLNAKKLAAEINVGVSTVTRYLRGERAPTLKNLICIADFFKCSTDFLLGLTDGFTPKNYLPCPPFCERVAQIPAENGLSVYRFCREIGISESSYYEWKRGEGVPGADGIMKIAENLKCSTDYILGRKAE